MKRACYFLPSFSPKMICLYNYNKHVIMVLFLKEQVLDG